MVRPTLVSTLLNFRHRMYELVDDPAIVVAMLCTHQVRGHHFLVTGNHHRRPVELRGCVQGERGLARSSRPAKMHREAGIQIGQRATGD